MGTRPGTRGVGTGDSPENLTRPVCRLVSLSPGRRRFLVIGASVMSASILTLGVISHLNPTSLGSPTRLCHFNTSSAGGTNTTPTPLPTTPTPLPTTPPPSVSSRSSSAAASPTALLAPTGAADLSPAVRYGSLAAVVLFVGAYSFGFGPGICSYTLASRGF